MPWCESHVVAVKGNDHNEFRLHENTTRCCGRYLLQPQYNVRQVSNCQRVSYCQRVIELQVGVFQSRLLIVWRRFLMTKWRSWRMQAFIGTCFLITSVTITFYGKLKKLRYCGRITSHWFRNITGVLKDKMSWRSVIHRNLLKVVQAKMMIQTFVITARRRSCLMFWKQHVNIEHKRTRDKRHCFICDSQKHFFYLLLSKFLFLPFSHGSWTEKEVLQHYSTSDTSLFGTLWALSIEEKDTETGISCAPSPFTLHEFSAPGRLDYYAV